jgi:predicted Fe-Mo cluster-binding NifX family protein
MRICVPTRDDRGLDAATFGHVGGAPYYTVADTDNGTVQTYRRAGSGADRDRCGPGARIRALGIDTVVCSDIGRRVMSAFEGEGITVLFSEGKTVREILGAAREGDLRVISADEICAGHGARHGSCGGADARRRSHRHHRERPGAGTS